MRLVALLVALLAVVAAIQYRWIGEISEADRTRLELAAIDESRAFGEAVDREITELFAHFLGAVRRQRGRPPRPDQIMASLLEAEATWTEASAEPGLLEQILWIDRPFSPRASARRLSRHQATEVELPPTLSDLRDRRGRRRGPGPRGNVLPRGPALLLPALGGPRGSRLGSRPPGSATSESLVVLLLSRTYLVDSLLPALAARLESVGFDVAVADETGTFVWTTSGNRQHEGFTRTGAFLRVRPFPGLFDPLRAGRRGSGASDRLLDDPTAGLEGPWSLLTRHRQGSIDAAVMRARRRNLAISLGTLAILGGSLLLLGLAARRAQATAQQQVEFVAGLTHELHTPLAAISAAASNLADGVVQSADRVQEYGALIRREGQRLEDLVGQSLELAGIESGAARAKAPIDAVEWIRESLDGCQWLVTERGATLDLHLDAARGLELAGDRMSLVQALRNLVTNALKYGPRGGSVTVRASARSGELQVEVVDEGPGFPTSDRERLFEPFVRGETARAGGSGIGLHLALRIVEDHGGEIELADRDDGRRGARAILRLPLSGSS